METIQTRTVSAIAYDIIRAWGPKVNYAAKPYLSAMRGIYSPSEYYGGDSAKSIVSYFLANASTFRGPEAKALKAELRSMFNIK